MLEAAIRADLANRESKPFGWTKTADAILATLERFASRVIANHPSDAMRTSRAGH